MELPSCLRLITWIPLSRRGRHRLCEGQCHRDREWSVCPHTQKGACGILGVKELLTPSQEPQNQALTVALLLSSPPLRVCRQSRHFKPGVPWKPDV